MEHYFSPNASKQIVFSNTTGNADNLYELHCGGYWTTYPRMPSALVNVTSLDKDQSCSWWLTRRERSCFGEVWRLSVCCVLASKHTYLENKLLYYYYYCCRYLILVLLWLQQELLLNGTMPFLLLSLWSQHVNLKGLLEMVKLPNSFAIIFEVTKGKHLYESNSEAFY